MSPFFRTASILGLLVLVTLATSTGCQKESASDSTGPATATKQVTVDVTGMT